MSADARHICKLADREILTDVLEPIAHPLGVYLVGEVAIIVDLTHLEFIS